jgi:hypothetical protein
VKVVLAQEGVWRLNTRVKVGDCARVTVTDWLTTQCCDRSTMRVRFGQEMKYTRASLSSIGNLVRKSRGLEFAEIEARFGCVGPGGKFNSSNTPSFFEESISRCDAFEGWVSSTGWYQRCDVFRNNGTRESVFFIDGSATGHRVTVRKASVGVATLPVMDYFKHRHPSFPTDVRVSLATETPFDHSIAPLKRRRVSKAPCRTPAVTYIRYKLCRNFKTSSGWSIDFSKTWALDPLGATAGALMSPGSSDATTRAGETLNISKDLSSDTRGREPSYELEVELENMGYVVENDDDHVAASLLLKTLDFLPTSAHYE